MADLLEPSGAGFGGGGYYYFGVGDFGGVVEAGETAFFGFEAGEALFHFGDAVAVGLGEFQRHF